MRMKVFAGLKNTKVGAGKENSNLKVKTIGYQMYRHEPGIAKDVYQKNGWDIIANAKSTVVSNRFQPASSLLQFF